MAIGEERFSNTLDAIHARLSNWSCWLATIPARPAAAAATSTGHQGAAFAVTGVLVHLMNSPVARSTVSFGPAGHGSSSSVR